MTTRHQIRQGDVLLIPIDTIPAGTEPVTPRAGRHILAEGEATGHAHTVQAAASTALLAGPNREMYLLIQEGEALLTHEEHGAHAVTGAYRVIHQREADSGQQYRPVMD